MNQILKNPVTGRQYDVQELSDLCKPQNHLWCGCFTDPQWGKCFVKVNTYGVLPFPAQKQFVADSQREVRTAEQVLACHVSCPQIYDHWNDPKKKEYVIIMQQLEGVTLTQWLQKRCGSRPLDQTELFIRCQILTGLCRQLQKMDRKGFALVHRDLKPDNILVHLNPKTKHWEPSLIDFGCARTNHIRNTGTPLYRAPEQSGIGLSDVRISCKTDIFSLGMILYYMTAGRVPDFEQDYVYSRRDPLNWIHVPSFPREILSLQGGKDLQSLQLDMTRLSMDDRPDYQNIIFRLGSVHRDKRKNGNFRKNSPKNHNSNPHPMG